jgi:hypothetical protein
MQVLGELAHVRGRVKALEAAATPWLVRESPPAEMAPANAVCATDRKQLVGDPKRSVTEAAGPVDPLGEGRGAEMGGSDATRIAKMSMPETEPLRQFVDAIVVPALVERYLQERARPSAIRPTLVVVTSAAPEA